MQERKITERASQGIRSTYQPQELYLSLTIGGIHVIKAAV